MIDNTINDDKNIAGGGKDMFRAGCYLINGGNLQIFTVHAGGFLV